MAFQDAKDSLNCPYYSDAKGNVTGQSHLQEVTPAPACSQGRRLAVALLDRTCDVVVWYSRSLL